MTDLAASRGVRDQARSIRATPVEERCRGPRARLRWRSRPPRWCLQVQVSTRRPALFPPSKWPRPQPTWAGPTPLVTPNGVTRRQKGSAEGRLTVGVCRPSSPALTRQILVISGHHPTAPAAPLTQQGKGGIPRSAAPRPRWWLGCGLVMSIGSSGTTINGGFGAGRRAP
jgi:hypothetical protein